MASLKTVLYLGVSLSAWTITAADEDFVPKAENVQWVSLDFKTILTWTTTASTYTHTVQYAEEGDDWNQILECIQVSESECDLTKYLKALDRTFTADIQTEPVTTDHDYNLEDFPHTYSPPFNPFKQSNISAAKLTVEVVDESRVTVNITDPLTSIHERGKQLSIRDVLKNHLKYKISYWKAESTGKRDIITDSSVAEVSELDAGHSYCFMVAAFIPSRPKTTQQGAWSTQRCTQGHISKDWSIGAWVGIVFILLTVLSIIITVTVLCCRCCRQRNKTLHTSQSSAPV